MECYGLDYWTEWFNVSHPNVNNGDFETFDKIRENGYDVCPPAMHVKAIHCQFNKVQKISGSKGRPKGKGGRKGFAKGGRRQPDRYISQLVDYTLSDDMYVECSPTTGLTCQNYQQPGSRNTCEDYAIRVLCSCGEC